jgi:hypothetical protein
LQAGFIATPETEHAADLFLLARQVKFVNRAIGLAGISPGLDATTDPTQPRVGFLERVFRQGIEAEIRQSPQRQQPAPKPNRVT